MCDKSKRGSSYGEGKGGMHATRYAALAEIGSIPESRKRERSDLGILVSHEDGPCGDAPSRRRDLPELVAAWNSSQKARAESIAEIEDWTLSGE